MRRFLFALAALLSLPAAAQEWQPFGVKEFGFTFDVPPGFELTENSEQGAAFEGENDAFLAVWGVNLPKSEFEAEIENRMAEDEADGWELTYRRVTPDWASYSGVRDEQIRYVRAIAICDDRAAVFVINYPRGEKIPYDPIVVRMVRSLKPEGC